MKIALRMILPLIGIGIAFAATPAEARNYDCSKAGNANKAACKGATSAPAPKPAAMPMPAAKPASSRNYDCSKAGNANKSVCKGAATPPVAAPAPAAKMPVARNYDCSKAGNANKTVCKNAAAPTPMAPQAAPAPSPATKSVNVPRRIEPTSASSPRVAANGPDGATAKCKDGSYSKSKTRTGTCSRHGGVASWY